MLLFSRLLLIAGILAAVQIFAESVTKDDIKLLTQQMDRRFDDLEIFMGLMTTVTIVVLSYVMYRIHRIEDKQDERTSEKLLFALREVAQKDPKVEKALKVVGLL